jgi:hypothetical protein
MQAVRTIDLDIAKSVFQVHGIDPRRQVSSQSRRPLAYPR